MAVNKIRLRNLDNEVLDYFRQNQNSITYDDLSQDVVTDIKNNIQVGNVNKYDDNELRTRIINLETNALTKDEAANTYAAQAEYDNSITVDNKIQNAIDSLHIEDTINDRFNNLTSEFVTRTSESITEDLLSYELQMKVNARYENRRPSEGGSGGGDISAGDFTKLQIQVNENTSNIENLNDFVNNNTVLKTDTISTNQLDNEAQTAILHARLDTKLIGMNDLEQGIRDALASTGGSINDTIDAIYQNSQDGQVGFSSFNQSEQKYTVKYGFVFDHSILVIPSSDKLAEAQTLAREENYDYIGDTSNNVIYVYNSENQSWRLDDSSTLFERIVGKLVVRFPGDVLCFCPTANQLKVILDLSEYLENIAIGIDVPSQQDFDSLSSKVDTIEDKVNKEPDYSSLIYYGETQPSDSSVYFWLSTSGTLQIKTSSGWQRVN